MRLLKTEHPGVLSAVVMKNGELITETTQTDQLYPQYSITKSLVSLVIGILIAEGKISLESTVGEFLPVPADAPLSGITLKALLSMKSGLNEELLFADRRDCPDYLAACLAQKIGEQHFFYNNASAYLAGRMAEAAMDVPLSDLIVSRIFTPLGIKEYAFETDPEGHFFGASGLLLNTRDLAKLGNSMLYSELYPEDWLRTALMPHAVNSEGKCYGYYFWLHPDYYYMSGKWGQRCMVIPKLNAVIAVNSEMKEDNTVSAFIRNELMPTLHGKNE